MNQKIDMIKTVRIAFVIQFILLAVFPVVNNEYNVWKITIWGLFAVLSLFLCVVTFFTKKMYKREVTKLIVVFAAINIISMLWGILHGVTVADSIRGVLPFVYFIYVYIIEKWNDREWNLKYEWMIAGVALIQALEIVGVYIYYDCIHTLVRVTYYIPASTRFITIYGIIFFFSMWTNMKERNIKKELGGLLGMVICWIAVVLTQTKSMLVCAVLGVLIVLGLRLLLTENRKKAILRGGVAAFILLLVSVLFFSFTSIGSRWSRWSSSIMQNENSFIEEEYSDNSYFVINTKEGESVVVTDSASRLYEVSAAIQNWKTSPILGKGCGYQWVNEEISDSTPRRYMHNLLAYMLMDYGIVGIGWLIVFGVYLLRLFVKVVKVRQKNASIFLNIITEFSIIIAAFVYANFFAVFRTIDFIFMFSIIVGIYCVNCQKVLGEQGNH